jgi:hypothetical protein
VDTRLRITDPSFELQRTAVPQILMEALAIIEAFDERKDLPACLVPRVIRLVMGQFIPMETIVSLHHADYRNGAAEPCLHLRHSE